jgi:hypothetical protein
MKGPKEWPRRWCNTPEPGPQPLKEATVDTNIVRGSLPEVTETQDERPCACYSGWVFVGYIDEHGEEREASYPCRRCAGETS